MLFQVEMDVRIPPEADVKSIATLKAAEKARCQELMTQGRWRHIWRVAGHYANISIFDTKDPADLHDILSTLPLFPYMDIKVTAICRHPSSVRESDD